MNFAPVTLWEKPLQTGQIQINTWTHLLAIVLHLKVLVIIGNELALRHEKQNSEETFSSENHHIGHDVDCHGSEIALADTEQNTVIPSVSSVQYTDGEQQSFYRDNGVPETSRTVLERG